MATEIQGELSDALTTQAKLARYLGVSKPYMTQLAEEGNILVKDENSSKIFAFDSLKNYLMMKKSGNEGVNYFKEKGLHERAKREITEIKLSETKNEMYPAEEVESAWFELLTILRNNLLAIPAKYSLILENKSRAEINSILTEEIENLLSEVSNYRVDGEKTA